MESPSFASHLGNGKWNGTKYYIDVCPICYTFDSLEFQPDGIWSCKGCHSINQPLSEFKSKLEDMGTIGQALAENIKLNQTAEGLIVVSEYKSDIKPRRIGTGFKNLDMMLGGLGDSGLTVLTGKRGEGKSTFAGQLALNAIQNGHNVCFYSGELSAHMFQNWIFSQASGDKNMVRIEDQFGNDHWIADEYVESRVRSWLGKKFVLYDNTSNKHSERNAILERFKLARRVYGCDLFFVDNLMTAKYAIDSEKDFWRAQSNFAGELKDFAQENSTHIVLVAHPKKGDSGDINDDVSGSADITNRADNVIRVKKTSEKENVETGADSHITVSKNRDFGRCGTIKFSFCPASRRLVEMDTVNIEDYGWIDLC